MIWPFGARKPQAAPVRSTHRAARSSAGIGGFGSGQTEAVRSPGQRVPRARPGVGLMFSELRAYEPGDDVRHLAGT